MRGAIVRQRGHRRGGQQAQAGSGLLLTGLLCIMVLVAGCGAAPPGQTHVAIPRATATATPIPIHFARPEFQAGVVFPRWGTSVYGPSDSGWATGVADVRQQTGARWIEMLVNLCQESATSTQVAAGPGTPSPDDVAAGILTARQQGFQVFVVAHLSLLHPTAAGDWGGFVSFSDPSQAHAWFESYWSVLEPYTLAAAQAQAEQFAIGNEYIGLELAPDDLWNTLLARVHAEYHGAITYNTNWNTLSSKPRAWMSNPYLNAIGVSTYESLVPRAMPLTVAQIEAVWKQRFLPKLDALSAATHKPIVLSEIGYRNTSDALYQPWIHQTNASADPALQAAAYEGAVRAALTDSHIIGTFFYAWQNGQFDPANQPAAQTLHSIYLSPEA